MELRQKKVVVTGGAGFIGSHLVDALIAHQNDVLVIDDFSSGSEANLRHHEGCKLLQIARTDVCDFSAMEKLLSKVDCVFHLATRNVRLSLRQPTIVHDVNVTGTLNVLKAAAAAGVSRFLYCSSSEVNGTADVVPMPEEYRYRPETIYGASKLAGEYYTQVFHRAGWLKTVIARPHNNYGPREHYEGLKGEVIPRFILWALGGQSPVIFGDGRQTRDFTYVEETASFLVRLLETEQALGETFNVCRGEEVSIAEIANMVCEATGAKVIPEYRASRPSDVLRLYGDPSKLHSVLGSSPSIPIREGLARTVNWFRHNVPVSEKLIASLRSENWEEAKAEPWLMATLSQGL